MSCVGDDYQCNGQATAYVTVEWSTAGSGSFDDPAILDPIYTPSQEDFDNGSVMLSLEATGEDNEVVVDDMILSFRTEPGQAGQPEGPDFVNTYYEPSSEYTTQAVQYADYYEWSVDPVEAGTFAGMSATGTITWNTSFLGTAVIYVKATNTCGEGELSEGFEVSIDNFTSVGEIENNAALAIYPNPNSGEFFIELLGEEFGQVDVRIYDITGILVYYESGECSGQKFSTQVDLSSYPQGMYLVKVSHAKGDIVKKLLLSR